MRDIVPLPAEAAECLPIVVEKRCAAIRHTACIFYPQDDPPEQAAILRGLNMGILPQWILS